MLIAFGRKKVNVREGDKKVNKWCVDENWGLRKTEWNLIQVYFLFVSLPLLLIRSAAVNFNKGQERGDPTKWEEVRRKKRSRLSFDLFWFHSFSSPSRIYYTSSSGGGENVMRSDQVVLMWVVSTTIQWNFNRISFFLCPSSHFTLLFYFSLLSDPHHISQTRDSNTSVLISKCIILENNGPNASRLNSWRWERREKDQTVWDLTVFFSFCHLLILKSDVSQDTPHADDGLQDLSQSFRQLCV